KEPDINEKFTRFFSTFTNFTKKNQNRRAMSLQTFLELPSFQQEQAIIGAKNYVEWYPKENPGDVTYQFSVNAFEFLRNMVFMDYQEMPEVKKVAKKKKWI
ncbi:phage replisome organizer protein, partial [Lactococcus hircilactis]